MHQHCATAQLIKKMYLFKIYIIRKKQRQYQRRNSMINRHQIYDDFW